MYTGKEYLKKNILNVYFGGHILALCDQFVMSSRKQQIISNNKVFTHISEQHIVFKFNEL